MPNFELLNTRRKPTTSAPEHVSKKEENKIQTSSSSPIEQQIDSSFLTNPHKVQKLKAKCEKIRYGLCSSKQKELSNLISAKCSKFKVKKTDKQKKECRVMLSAYCYIYPQILFSRCLDTDNYDPYVPNANYTTKKAAKKYHTIPIEVINDTPTTTSIKPTKISTKTSQSVSKSSISIGAVNIDDKNTSSDLFDDRSPHSWLKSAEKMKQMRDFCIVQTTKNERCSNMLSMLINKFKTCETASISDSDCQSFKKEFCNAYTSFPCCADVI
jgi:hypothetical protein